jgi:hypothetical protein
LSTQQINALMGASRHDIEQQLRRSAPVRVAFWAGKEWLDVVVFERHYFFPPNLGGREIEDKLDPSKRIKADGRLRISDNYVPVLDKKHNTRGMRAEPGASADDVVAYLVENYGDRGVAWLRPEFTEAQTAAVIAEAERRYAKANRSWAEQEIQARNAVVENWRKQPGNAGRDISSAPPPTATQKRAMEFLDSLAGVDEFGVQRGQYVCTHEGYDTDDAALFARHMKASHGTDWSPEDAEKPAASTSKKKGA